MKIGLGTVQFGVKYGISNSQGQTSAAEVSRILNQAYKLGVQVIDTAISYGNAEEVLGTNDCARFKVVSKFMPAEGGQTVTSQLQTSLSKLQLTSLYGFLAHRPASFIHDPQQWSELQVLKQQGLIEKAGFSLNAPEELDALLAQGIEPDLVQVPYNYFDNRFKSRLIALKEKGCEIHTRSAFLQGLFFTDMEAAPAFFDEVKAPVKKLQQQYGPYLSAALLQYVMEQEFIDHVIIGVENEQQLVENITQLSSAERLPGFTGKVSSEVLMPMHWPK